MRNSKNDAPKGETAQKRRHHPIHRSKVSPGVSRRKWGSFTSVIPSGRERRRRRRHHRLRPKPKTDFHPDPRPQTSTLRIDRPPANHTPASATTVEPNLQDTRSEQPCRCQPHHAEATNTARPRTAGNLPPPFSTFTFRTVLAAAAAPPSSPERPRASTASHAKGSHRGEQSSLPAAPRD